MIKVLVVDDHAVVRAGIRQFFSEVADIEVTDEAASAAAAIAHLRQQRYDVALLDVSMPDRTGVDLLQQIRREWPDLPVLVLSMHPENRYAVQLLRHGARGYLQKESMPAELINAIRTVCKGKRFISDSTAQLLASELDSGADRPAHAGLSDREREIFLELARGVPVGEIAHKLLLSVKTVSTYRTRLLEKMALSCNADLTYYAIKNNLID